MNAEIVRLASINPRTGEHGPDVAACSLDDVAAATSRAGAVAAMWAATPAVGQHRHLHAAGTVERDDVDGLVVSRSGVRHLGHANLRLLRWHLRTLLAAAGCEHNGGECGETKRRECSSHGRYRITMTPPMTTARDILRALSLPDRDANDLPSSAKRFDDGGQYRVEIPSCEGPKAMQAVVAEAAARNVTVHRVSQGSGIMLQTDAEISEMLTLGRAHGIEVCLFVGPRANWDVGAQAATAGGRVLGSSLRGADQLAYGIEDVLHGSALGLRSILVADLGQLQILGEMKKRGDLPADFVLKVSVTLAAANPATARLLEDLGATSINLPVDLSLAQIAAIRQTIDVAIDFYVEAPDDFGGTVRHYETAELVRVAAPIYLKYGLRNSPGLYPSGQHLEATVLALSRERVRRASIGLALLRRHLPEAMPSPIHRQAAV